MRDTCITMIYELAKQDDRVVLISSDFNSSSLLKMKDEFPERCYLEPLDSINIIAKAAKLVGEGFIPYVNTTASFLSRCHEQITHDVCMANLPVRLIGDGAGLVNADLGARHVVMNDVSIMRTLPNMTVVAVTDAEEMIRFMHETLDWPQPIYIRLAKGGDEIISCSEHDAFIIGKAIHMHESIGDKNFSLLMISTGVMTQRTLKVVKALELLSINITLLHCHTIKPLDDATILHHAKTSDLIVTVEENTLVGGLGSAITDFLTEMLGRNAPLIKRYGLPDVFPDKYESQELLLNYYGLSVEKLLGDITEVLEINFPEIFEDEVRKVG